MARPETLEPFNVSEWTFERSSGYAGFRNDRTGEWIYECDYDRLCAFKEDGSPREAGGSIHDWCVRAIAVAIAMERSFEWSFNGTPLTANPRSYAGDLATIYCLKRQLPSKS